MHLHLDPIGGVAGDMFAAALLDAFPNRATGLRSALDAAGLSRVATVHVEPHNDGILAGTRFRVTPASTYDDETHHRYRDIRSLLESSNLEPGVANRALAIFALLADAEGRVHGVPTDEVSFHEVGAWDSIADIVSAAWLIESFPGATWSCAPLPVGQGRMRIAHGEVPVPGPATALLLEGFPVFQDGRNGERITPTGAAIVRHLDPGFDPVREVMRLECAGHGFGTSRLEGLSNILRVLAFSPSEGGVGGDPLVVCQFEVDDQTPEDLSVALENLRAVDGVLDVLQTSVHAKKGRVAAHVQLLARPDHVDPVIEQCFVETTTLGVRWHRVTRATLSRESNTHTVGGRAVRVKRARRPRGLVTGKAEMDDLAPLAGGRVGRERARHAAENAATNVQEEDTGND